MSSAVSIARIASSLARFGSPTETLAVAGSMTCGAGAPLARVEGADRRVPLASGDFARYVSLDYASRPPCLEAARRAVEEARASPVTSEAWAAARASVGAFVGARAGDVVVFTRDEADARSLLAAFAHRPGARVVDATRVAPHRTIEMGEGELACVAISGRALHAPFGAGALVARGEGLDAARATESAVSPVGAIALGAACATLAAIGMDAIARHEERLRVHLARGLDALPEVETLVDPASPGAAMFNLRGWSPRALAAALEADYAIGVGDGGSAVRVSFGVGTRLADIERLLCALDSLAAEARGRETRT